MPTSKKKFHATLCSHNKLFLVMSLLTGAYDLFPHGGDHHHPHLPHRHKRVNTLRPVPSLRLQKERLQPLPLDAIFLCYLPEEILSLAPLWRVLHQGHVNFRIVTTSAASTLLHELLQNHHLPYGIRHRMVNLPAIAQDVGEMKGKIPETYLKRLHLRYQPRFCIASDSSWFQRSLSNFYYSTGSQKISLASPAEGQLVMKFTSLETQLPDQIDLVPFLAAEWNKLLAHYSIRKFFSTYHLPHKPIVLMIPSPKAPNVDLLLSQVSTLFPDHLLLLYTPRPYLMVNREVPNLYLCDPRSIPYPLAIKLASVIFSYREFDLLLASLQESSSYRMTQHSVEPVSLFHTPSLILPPTLERIVQLFA